jgi:antimicrobial peptide system SdpA family protein
MRHTVAVGVTYAAALAGAGVASLAASLPSTVLWNSTQLPVLRSELNRVAGQDFAFFTRSPESDQLDVYRLGADGTVGPSLLVTPQIRTANLAGVSRTQRAQGPELALLLRAVPAGRWIDCTVLARTDCLAGLSHRPMVMLHNNSPVPTLCGSAALSIESTTKWAYRRLTDDRYSIDKVAAVSIDCIDKR